MSSCACSSSTSSSTARHWSGARTGESALQRSRGVERNCCRTGSSLESRRLFPHPACPERGPPMTSQHPADRRSFLVTGGLSCLGLGLSDLERLRAVPAASPAAEKRRRNSCVFLFLFGGPSHIDL